jgi:hypothetical protein
VLVPAAPPNTPSISESRASRGRRPGGPNRSPSKPPPDLRRGTATVRLRGMVLVPSGGPQRSGQVDHHDPPKDPWRIQGRTRAMRNHNSGEYLTCTGTRPSGMKSHDGAPSTRLRSMRRHFATRPTSRPVLHPLQGRHPPIHLPPSTNGDTTVDARSLRGPHRRRVPASVRRLRLHRHRSPSPSGMTPSDPRTRP